MSDEPIFKRAEAALQCYTNFCSDFESCARDAAPMLSRSLEELLAYLAEREKLEAEEALPVDEAWLRSIGFVDGWPERIHIRLETTWIERSFRAAHNVWVVNGTCYPPEQWGTRGQVLRLLDVLGVKPGKGE